VWHQKWRYHGRDPDESDSRGPCCPEKGGIERTRNRIDLREGRGNLGNRNCFLVASHGDLKWVAARRNRSARLSRRGRWRITARLEQRSMVVTRVLGGWPSRAAFEGAQWKAPWALAQETILDCYNRELVLNAERREGWKFETRCFIPIARCQHWTSVSGLSRGVDQLRVCFDAVRGLTASSFEALSLSYGWP
jgi:hypothetical protein